MSPEQKVGKDVTVRSDLYSLGLVLHEMFTGKARQDTSSNPIDLVKDLDPAIERLIVRCLEEDPKRRPSSALSVAMALPGADPIAAALAAGETPSPEMVAASREKEGFSPRAAWACFGVIVGLMALLLTRSSGITATRYVPHPTSVLAFRAQETLKQLGYPDAPVSTARGFECCNAGVLRMLGERTPQDRAAILASNQPAVLLFWYRQHGRDILPELGPEGRGMLSYARPANTEPGMIRLRLDPNGRLVEFEARPEEMSGARFSRIDPSILFAEAGLDRTLFSETTPREPPPMAFDQHFAWTGSYGNGRTEKVRVSAAYWEGRPVYFRVRGDPWEEPVGLVRPKWQDAVAVLQYLTLIFGSVTVALRHARLGRGDRRGSARVAVAAFLVFMAGWAMTGPHVARFYEFQLFGNAVSFAAFYAGVIWALYMAVEPYVRRHWPDALISWTRVLSGQVRNPLVASHVLVGVCLEVAFVAAVRGVFWVVRPPTGQRIPISIAALQGGTFPLGAWLQMAVGALAFVMAFVLIIVLLRLVLRRLWIADLLGAILIFALLNPTGAVSAQGDAIIYVVRLPIAWALLWSLRRFGLLSVLVAIQCDWLLASQVFGGWDSWYVGWSLLPWAAMVSVAAWALWVILSTQRTRFTESPAYWPARR
jgi:serine/threonine-protein kinase